MPNLPQITRAALLASVLIGLTACGGGEEKKEAAPAAPATPPPPPTTIGGTVSGLAGGTIELQLNGANDLTVKANGKFKFPKPLKKGDNYTVAIKTVPVEPVKQTCTLSNESGTMANKEITNVTVNCSTVTFAVGGTVKGLSGKGLVVGIKGGAEAKIEKNGSFLFPETRLADGTDYSVELVSEPKNQSCKMEATAVAANAETLNIVAVTCGKKHKK